MARTGTFWMAVALLGIAVSAQQPKPKFEAASIKKVAPGSPASNREISSSGVFETTTNLPQLIYGAYGIEPRRIIGAPTWARGNASDDFFEVKARAGTSASFAEMQPMIQSLLEDRFKLTSHTEMRAMPHFALTLPPSGKLGAYVRPVEDCSKRPPSPAKPAGTTFRGSVCGRMEHVARVVSFEINEIVVDKTGIAGTFEAFLFKPEELTERPTGPPPSPIPTIQRAVLDQWGLKLDSSREPVQVLVIDSVQQPTEN